METKNESTTVENISETSDSHKKYEKKLRKQDKARKLKVKMFLTLLKNKKINLKIDGLSVNLGEKKLYSIKDYEMNISEIVELFDEVMEIFDK